MLQQTQVERVIPFYKKFIKQFPTAKRLADAPLSEVLKAWQGLGYNRRAKMLHAAAKQLANIRGVHVLSYRTKREHTGVRLVEKLVGELEKLSGVGPYTARAVAAFAFNQDVVVVETNIRTAVIHHFFAGNASIYGSVSDAQIQGILERALPKGKSREWYSALMDYGAHLKRSGVSHNARSRTYAKQSRFAGSLREARGTIVRELARGAASPARLILLLGDSRRAQMRSALRALWTERMIEKRGADYALMGDKASGNLV